MPGQTPRTVFCVGLFAARIPAPGATSPGPASCRPARRTASCHWQNDHIAPSCESGPSPDTYTKTLISQRWSGFFFCPGVSRQYSVRHGIALHAIPNSSCLARTRKRVSADGRVGLFATRNLALMRRKVQG
jgi:hypothetical protein